MVAGRISGPARGLLALLFLLSLAVIAGCRAGAAKPGETVRLQPGERYHYTDHISSKDTPGLVRGQDGLLRLPSWGASQPVLPVTTSTVISRRFVAPGPLFLETGYGLVPLEGKTIGGAARFVVCLAYGRNRVVFRREAHGARQDDPGWTPTRIQIPAKAGEEVEVQLAVEKRGLFASAPRNAVWVNPTIAAPAAQRKPNLVVVVLDAVRPDHLGCYGYARNTSPWIDRMAREGAVYLDATSQATWTLASVDSLLTSTYPLLIGAAQLAAQGQQKTGPTLETVDMSVSLQGALRRLGYTTLASAGGGFLDPAAGFSSGFDWYWTPPADGATFIEDHLAALKSRLSACPSHPFFLLLHTYEAHNYLQGWGHDLGEFGHGYRGKLLDKKVLFDTVTRCVSAGLSPADLQYLQDLYDAEIHHTDHELGQFVDWLFSQSWGRDTVVVLIADHGESFGEHGKLHHGGPPYREVTRVPLIVRYPNGKSRGRQVYDPVALVDIMPTLVTLAGGQAPPRVVGQPLPAPADSDRFGPIRAILSGCQSPPVLSTRMGNWTYLSGLGSSREELYDIYADPGQLHNLVGSGGEPLARMRRALAGEVMRAGDAYHLVASGRRPSDIAVTLSCDGGFRYLLQPTARRLPVTNAQQATLVIPAGDAPQVVLFGPSDPKAVIRVEARMDGAMVWPRRVHLGTDGARAARLPVEIGGSTARLIQTAAPPPLGSDEWGLWLWSTASAAALATPTSPGAAVEMSEEARKRLRALGYVK